MMETIASQYRRFLIRPTLDALGLWSQAAENLLIGTAAHESNGFQAIHQYGKGPALSMYQIEPATHNDLWEHSIGGYARRNAGGMAMLLDWLPRMFPRGQAPDAMLLLTDLRYATAICRLLYWRVPRALPAPDDLGGLAGYWKEHYNTVHGAGHESEWLDAYARHCQDEVA
ncbi:MAG: hypothetical protein KDD73_15550 [Anaerolineales bacterium]|nr:hypothetical protein [Anaerolineales bacterium]MCP5230912.1 hypothetical protein [Zoogloeaceae bacterium]